MKRIVILCMCILLLFACVSRAETVTGDLSKRFSNETDLEYGGVKYRVRLRTSTSLVISTLPDGQIAMLGVIVTDDETKKCTYASFDVDSLHSDGLPLYGKIDVASDRDTLKASCAEMLARVNSLFPSALIQHYIFLDADGMQVLDGEQLVISDDAREMQEILQRRARSWYSGSKESASDVYGKLSNYIFTDLKAGAFTKVMDRLDRFERTAGVFFALEDGEEGTLRPFDEDALYEVILSLFYEEKVW